MADEVQMIGGPSKQEEAAKTLENQPLVMGVVEEPEKPDRKKSAGSCLKCQKHFDVTLPYENLEMITKAIAIVSIVALFMVTNVSLSLGAEELAEGDIFWLVHTEDDFQKFAFGNNESFATALLTMDTEELVAIRDAYDNATISHHEYYIWLLENEDYQSLAEDLFSWVVLSIQLYSFTMLTSLILLISLNSLPTRSSKSLYGSWKYVGIFVVLCCYVAFVIATFAFFAVAADVLFIRFPLPAYWIRTWGIFHLFRTFMWTVLCLFIIHHVYYQFYLEYYFVEDLHRAYRNHMRKLKRKTEAKKESYKKKHDKKKAKKDKKGKDKDDNNINVPEERPQSASINAWS